MNTKITETTIKALAKHPYIWAAVICLVLNPFFYGAAENIPVNVPTLIFLALIGGAAVFLLKKFRSGKINAVQLAALQTAAISAATLLAMLYNRTENKSIWYFIGGYAAVIILYRKADRKAYNEQINSLLIISVGAIIKLYYVLETSVFTRQHDVGDFDWMEGHAGYIGYLLETHHLPDFDVREHWQFSHPPLHHIISAVWIYFNENILTVDYSCGRESLQMLSLFYSLCIMISAYKILRHFHLKGCSMYIPLAIINFHPSFIILSGSINNDSLSIAFVLGAVLCALKWYRDQTPANILKIAFCLGLGMMSKLSAALAAPAIAALFLIVFIKNFKKRTANLIGQFAAFGAVCAPLGLWYQVRNYLKFGVPIMYVHELDTAEMQYIGDQNFLSRITDFSLIQFRNVFLQWAYLSETEEVCGYNEYNPIIALLKTSVFDEGSNNNDFKGELMTTACTVLFWTALAIAAIAFVCMIIASLTKGREENMVEKLFILLFYVTMTVNFYKLAKDYPFTCSMNFRYITPTVITGSLFMGILLKRHKRLQKTFTAVTAIFVLCSAYIYLFAF